MSSLVKFSLFLTFALQLSDCAKILVVINSPFHSHTVVFKPVIKELAARGHSLTIFAFHSFGLEENSNVTWHRFSGSFVDRFSEDMVTNKLQNYSWITGGAKHMNNIMELIRSNGRDPHFQRLFKDAKRNDFDLIIGEVYYGMEVYLAETFDCPVISFIAIFSQIINSEILTTAFHPTIEPDHSLMSYELPSFQQRLISLTEYFVLRAFTEFDAKRSTIIMAKIDFNYDLQFFESFYERVAAFLTFTSPVLMFNLPKFSNIHHVGFIHMEPAKELPDDQIKNYLDNSRNGAVLMSFGSIFQTKLFGQKIIQTFLLAFEKLPYSVLWKTDEELEDLPPNVKTFKWLPQSDVLAHPNLKLLITHGGLRSIEESVVRKVPMLVIPFVYEQSKNGEFIVQSGIGKQCDINEMTVESFVDSIKRIIQDEKYKNNVIELSERLDNVTAMSREIAVHVIERMIRHKNITMKFAKLNRIERNFFEEYQVDCYLFTVFLVYCIYKILQVIARIIKWIMRIIRKTFFRR